jgi:hypothetical protein
MGGGGLCAIIEKYHPFSFAVTEYVQVCVVVCGKVCACCERDGQRAVGVVVCSVLFFLPLEHKLCAENDRHATTWHVPSGGRVHPHFCYDDGCYCPFVSCFVVVTTRNKTASLACWYRKRATLRKRLSSVMSETSNKPWRNASISSGIKCGHTWG